MSTSLILFWNLLSGFLFPFSSRSLIHRIHPISPSPAFLTPPLFLFLPLLFTTSNLDYANKKIFIIFFFYGLASKCRLRPFDILSRIFLN